MLFEKFSIKSKKIDLNIRISCNYILCNYTQ